MNKYLSVVKLHIRTANFMARILQCNKDTRKALYFQKALWYNTFVDSKQDNFYITCRILFARQIGDQNVKKEIKQRKKYPEV